MDDTSVMPKSILHALLLGISLLLAMVLYGVVIAGEDRYSIFDLLRGTPVTGTIGQAVPLPASETTPKIPVAEPVALPGVDLNSTALLEQVNRSLADLTERVVPSVVSIDTTKTVEVSRIQPVDPFGFFGYRRMNQRYQEPGLGSGVIVSKEGHVLTNHHVVAGVDEIQITTHEGGLFPAQWVGSDPTADLAVLRILVPADLENPPVFQPLPFADSDTVRVGEQVLAVGNPFGLSESITRGIVSAKQRRLSDGGSEYFQVDAVINPGNSGGPLVDIYGRIIGINTAIFTGQQNVRVWQGIGLAIPANEAREVYEAVAFGKPLIRGYLGLTLDNLNAFQARAMRLRTTRGALVTHVEDGSPAEAAGILPGDFLVKFDDDEVPSAEETIQRIRRLEAGAEVNLTVVRKDQSADLTVTVAERQDSTTLQLRSDIPKSGQEMAAALGLSVRDLAEPERETLGLRPEHPAILISDVEAGSQAENGGIKAGDLIHAVNRDLVYQTADLFELLGSLPSSRDSVLVLSRGGRQINVYLNPGR